MPTPERAAARALPPRIRQWALFVLGRAWVGRGHPEIADQRELAKFLLSLEDDDADA